ncbi:hypothetical protein F4X86_02485 [Candidatus Saccharibacteria bacterium]|nr:hypothetical protein [Candidatus Saccharibacteria bacterium]
MFFSRFFGLENVYGRKYVPALFFDAAYLLAALIAVLIAAAVFGRLLSPWLILPLIILIDAAIVYAARKIVQSVHVGRTLAERRYRSGNGNAIDISAAHDELHAPSGSRFHSIDMRTRQLSVGEGWQAYDVLCDTYSRQFGVSYKSKQSFRTVFEAGLSRPVPHFVFDSKTAGKRNFRRVYANGRSLFVSGRFNYFFAVRTTAGRQSGVSSLLTPEVKQALLFLKEYDIELVGKTLFCCAPLLEGEKLDNFLTNSRSLRTAVNRALEAAERDSFSKEETIRLTRRLLKNPSVYAPATVASGSLTAGLFLIAVTGRESRLLSSLAICGVILLYCLGGLTRTVNRNRRLLRDLADG